LVGGGIWCSLLNAFMFLFRFVLTVLIVVRCFWCIPS